MKTNESTNTSTQPGDLAFTVHKASLSRQDTTTITTTTRTVSTALTTPLTTAVSITRGKQDQQMHIRPARSTDSYIFGSESKNCICEKNGVGNVIPSTLGISIEP